MIPGILRRVDLHRHGPRFIDLRLSRTPALSSARLEPISSIAYISRFSSLQDVFPPFG